MRAWIVLIAALALGAAWFFRYEVTLTGTGGVYLKHDRWTKTTYLCIAGRECIEPAGATKESEAGATKESDPWAAFKPQDKP